MDDLVQWLRVQLDEDERVANAGTEPFLHGDRTGLRQLHPQITQYVYNWTPARVLREVEAKRRILARHAPMSGGACEWCWGNDDKATWPCADVRDVASVYSDRPGYREEWRP